MTNTRVRWGLAALSTVIAEVALIALSVACVAVYSYTIRTGETEAFYRAFAQDSGPWVSLIAGGPVFFLISRWIRRRAATAAIGTAIAMWGLYLAIEVAVLVVWPGGVGAIQAVLPFVIGGMILKLAGAWFGASPDVRAPVASA